MFTQSEIIKRVEKPTKTDYIGLKYSFLPSSNSNFGYIEADIDTPISENEKKFFRKKLKDHRLVLTVGGLIKKLSGNKVSSTVKFGENDCIIDLTKCENGYFIKPYETVIIFSNEWIRLDTKTYLNVFSKVSNYSKGLSITATFLDSQWQGLIQMLVTNNSDKHHSIKVGDEIASAFFIKLEGAETEKGDEHASDASHYKNDWQTIMQEKRDPFSPEKKEKAVPSVKNNIINFLKKYKSYIIGFFTSGAALSIFAIGFKFYSNIKDLDEFKKMSKDNNTILLQIQNDIKSINYNTVKSGPATILLRKGEFTAIERIKLRDSIVNAKVFIQNISPALGSTESIAYKILPIGSESFLEVRISTKKPAKTDKNFELDWFIVPK